jgi:glycine/D-amino acid oxidase-like deaminating enzyme
MAADSETPAATDVAIIGGGVMGASLAFWLRHLDPTRQVTVIERDPTWSCASSALSAASIRQQYTTAVNIDISSLSVDLLRSAHEWLAVEDDRPDLQLIEDGYLYLAGSPTAAEALQAAHRLQKAHGADVVLLEPAALAERFPWLKVSDLTLGSLGLSGEGWFDGYRLLGALTRKARALGVQFLRGEAVQIERLGRQVSAVVLRDGRRVAAGQIVNAAGPWSRAVAAMAGVEIPVAARRRTVFVLSCPTPLPRFPLLIDTTGFWIRPDGAFFIGGAVPAEDTDDLPLEPDIDSFENDFWPSLAHRVPAFESLRVERAWAGYYEMNTVDHNGLVGPHPALDNFHCLCGFSGHGLQQAPVVGRALAERLLYGGYRTIDISALDTARLVTGQWLREDAVIG